MTGVQTCALPISQELAGWIFQAARFGVVEIRSEALEIPRGGAERPRISALNHHFSSNGQPVVDPRHATCHFPAGHEQLLAAMDGIRPAAEMEERAKKDFPELDFPRWLAHLAERGLLV